MVVLNQIATENHIFFIKALRYLDTSLKSRAKSRVSLFHATVRMNNIKIYNGSSGLFHAKKFEINLQS